MKQSGSSAARLLVLLALLAIIAAGSYWKVPAARAMVDQKLPLVKETLARFGAAPAEEPTDATAPPTGEAAAPAAAAAPMTFAALAADPTAWPRKVRLKKAIEVPAVVAGKEVGKVTVAAGTEVNLARMKDGSLGIEYQGGGKWLKPEDTDVMERVRPPAPKPAL